MEICTKIFSRFIILPRFILKLAPQFTYKEGYTVLYEWSAAGKCPSRSSHNYFILCILKRTQTEYCAAVRWKMATALCIVRDVTCGFVIRNHYLLTDPFGRLTIWSMFKINTKEVLQYIIRHWKSLLFWFLVSELDIEINQSTRWSIQMAKLQENSESWSVQKYFLRSMSTS